MERISLQTDRKAIISEHVHRYELSSKFAKGSVLDISCGIGYGSKILCKNSEVSNYTGIDISEIDIEYASKNFTNQKVNFAKGDICALNFQDESFDTVVCLETLEHLNDPEIAIKELARVLKKDALIVGSVPEGTYDEKCERAYGPNPYHFHKFSKDKLKQLLDTYFLEAEIITVGVTLGTLVEGQQVNPSNTTNFQPEGSYFFIASKSKADLKSYLDKIKGMFIPALSMLDYDEELVSPLRQTIQDQEKLITSRDSALVAINELVEKKDEAINRATAFINERDRAISSMERLIKDRDEAIKAMEEVIEKRWAIIQEYDAKIKTLEGVE